MNKIFSYFIFCFTLFYSRETYSQDSTLHTINFENEKGDLNSFSKYSGKRVLLILVASDAIIDNIGLNELQTKFPDLVVLELPVKKLSKSAPITKSTANGVLVTKETNDSTDVNGRLLNWLTRKEGNQHFTVDQLQVGQKYFIDGTGVLYAVMPPEFKLNDPRIEAILTRTSFVPSSKN